ncbi:hypothetical protein BC830DRAFT_1138698 [Chytriomyces sp. MP71]|nr:hypothetical protein BC830DRAFT_1138698 [Chytriomyces sp. MP71]
MLKLRNWNHASVILDRMDNDPHNSCVNLSPKHPAGHEVYISYAREVDTQAAISLQTSFDTFKVSSFIDKTCGLGLKGYGYITSKTRKSILGIPVPSRVPGSSTTATSIPSPPASIPLHPNEIIALEGVSKAVVLLVSPFAVKLMDRRLMCGLADSLYEEWKRALVISQSQCIKLLVLRVVSERDAELPTNVCEAVKSILSELDLAGTPFTVPLSVVASVVEDGGLCNPAEDWLVYSTSFCRKCCGYV